MKICYYVSSHGFGHAKRSAAMMKNLVSRNPELEIYVRTLSKPELFGQIDRTFFGKPKDDFEIVESDALKINQPGTIESLNRFLENYDAVLKEEIEFVQRSGICGAISDVPFIAGDVASGRFPCATVVNFTWDWIMEPLLKESDPHGLKLNFIRQAYRKMTLILQTPFSHPMIETFLDESKIYQCPFALCDSETEERELAWGKIRETLGIAGNDFKDVIFYDIRSLPMSKSKLLPVAESVPNGFFLVRGPSTATVGENVAILGPEFAFDNIFNACTVFVCKLGYCTVGKCVAGKKRLLFPTRDGFREDNLLKDISKYVPAVEISKDSILQGTWVSALKFLLECKSSGLSLNTDGVNVCSEQILRHFEHN